MHAYWFQLLTNAKITKYIRRPNKKEFEIAKVIVVLCSISLLLFSANTLMIGYSQPQSPPPSGGQPQPPPMQGLQQAQKQAQQLTPQQQQQGQLQLQQIGQQVQALLQKIEQLKL
jgi:hypothetical protein